VTKPAGFQPEHVGRVVTVVTARPTLGEVEEYKVTGRLELIEDYGTHVYIWLSGHRYEVAPDALVDVR